MCRAKPLKSDLMSYPSVSLALLCNVLCNERINERTNRHRRPLAAFLGLRVLPPSRTRAKASCAPRLACSGVNAP